MAPKAMKGRPAEAKKAPAMKAPATKAPAMKAPAMKAAAGSTLTKSALAEVLATATELGKKDCASVLDSMADIFAKELKQNGKVTLPGVCMVKTRVKPATKAGTRSMFGKTVKVAAKPASTA